MNDYCGFCAASQGSVEKPVARESLRTLRILVAFVPASPVQIHPGDHLSKELYEALKFPAVPSGSVMEEEVGGIVSPSEGGLGCLCLCFFFQVHGSTARFQGHLILLLDSLPHALALNCVMQAAHKVLLWSTFLRPQRWKVILPLPLSDAPIFENRRDAKLGPPNTLYIFNVYIEQISPVYTHKH